MSISADQARYSARWIRFVRMPLHEEAYRAAYLDQSSSSRNELMRLSREFQTLPTRHAGWCVGECPAERCGLGQVLCARRGHFHSACGECRRLRASMQYRDIGVEIRGIGVASSQVPDPVMLDLERAIAVLGVRESAGRLARYLSEGAA